MNKPCPGYFGVEGHSGVIWENCRERFATTFGEQIEGFFFSHKGIMENVVNFIEKTETEILEVPKSVFNPTNRGYALWVEPSMFWKCCEMRRSLFTILLRCGQSYEGNYDEALFSTDYAKRTKDAIVRFLFGFTKYIPEGYHWNYKGWVAIFENKSVRDIRQHLVSVNNGSQSFIGAGSLWS